MKVSDAGVKLVKEFEGFVSRPYRDIVGVWTIGYGHTSGVGPNTRPLTEKQASELLKQDLDKKYGPPVNALKLPINQNQFDALVSFVYNCGPGAIAGSTGVGRALRAHQWDLAAKRLLDWCKAGSPPRVIPGLQRRRLAEKAVFEREPRPNAALLGYTKNEIAWIREYDSLKRQKKDVNRRRVLRGLMLAQRKRIWHAAQPKSHGGDGRGWAYGSREARYHSLLARTS